MIKKLFIVVMVFLISGCGHKMIWVGSNSSSDLQECRRESALKFQPSIYKKKIGSSYTQPVSTSCNRLGDFVQCETTGGEYIPPAEVSVDANEKNRRDFFYYCMESKGNKLMEEDKYNLVQEYERDKKIRENQERIDQEKVKSYRKNEEKEKNRFSKERIDKSRELMDAVIYKMSESKLFIGAKTMEEKRNRIVDACSYSSKNYPNECTAYKKIFENR